MTPQLPAPPAPVAALAPPRDFRHEVAHFAACMEIATGKVFDYGEVYLSLYSELEVIPVLDMDVINALEDKRAMLDEMLLAFRDEDDYEQERAQLRGLYALVSLQYQIARGIRTLPKYNTPPLPLDAPAPSVAAAVTQMEMGL
ncbi:MAG: hypothetical protein LC130_03965 [Bryobacterales bacterium]|nr:hypothetical protein [Bryobacterales bacterium]